MRAACAAVQRGIAAQAPLVITMGDPAGIGPEIVMKALAQRPAWCSRVVVAGDLATLQRAQACLGLPDAAPLLEVLSLDATIGATIDAAPSAIRVASVAHLDAAVPWGRVHPAAGAAAAACLSFAVREVLHGRASGVVTAPIHKEAWAAAGIPHAGHTEYLQALAADHCGCGIADLPVRMMLSAPGLRTVLVSIHVSLRQALDAVTTPAVLETLLVTARHFERLGQPAPRMAVAGLNPHAGEGGLFGREEIDVIAPAVQQALALGMNVSGPHAPDTVFMRARQGDFDVVVAMYHDQGLIPVKLLGLDHGVNTTLGLPFLRTSPDHGTAFELAGTGRASAASLMAAIEAAFEACEEPAAKREKP